MVLHPNRYAELLAEKVRKHDVKCWLVNTGWTGGPYGEGERMPIKTTRRLLKAAMEGELDDVEYRKDPVFGLDVPLACEGVPAGILTPRETWKDKTAYDAKARELADRFRENFRDFAAEVSEGVRNAGPIG